jgi:cytochrome c556
MSGRGRAIAVVVALGVGAAVAAGGAWAQSAAAQAVKDRQANFKQLGGAFKALNDQLKADKPDMAVIKASALKMKALAAQEPTWFPAGSGPEAGVKTAAKPQIWSDAAGFAARVKTLQLETTKLADAAAGGSLDAVKAQVPPTGKACAGCHDNYRVKPPA